MSKVDISTLAEAILPIIEGKQPAEAAKIIAGYMVAERRTGEIDALLRKIKKLRQQKTGVTEAEVTSAFPLSGEVRKEVRAIIGNKNVILNEEIDKDLIGGIRIEANGQLLDLSVRNRLNQLKSGVN